MIMQLALIRLSSLNQISGDVKLRKIWRIKKVEKDRVEQYLARIKLSNT